MHFLLFCRGCLTGILLYKRVVFGCPSGLRKHPVQAFACWLLGYCMVAIVLPLSGHLCRLSMLVATVSSVLVIAVQVAQPASKVGCCQVWNFAEEELVCSCIALSCMSVTSFLSRCMRRRIQHIHGNCDLNSTSTNQSNTR